MTVLSENELKKIALDECVEMIGKELVYQHKELCCSTYGMSYDNMFEYNLGMDTEEKEYKMGDETPMEYYAFVVVNPQTGEVTRDYESSILPNQYN